MLAIGLMSGTSLDGVDAALVKIENDTFILEKFITCNYDKDFKKALMLNLNNETAKLSEISSLNFELGHKFVEAIDALLQNTKFHYEDIAFVASHGQTIWHDPKGGKSSRKIPSTLQIGEPSVISYKTGIKTISNFRTMDIAAGGEGAPLVPFSEYLLFRSDSQNIVLQNIGGIGNLTYLPKKATINDLISFDTGPGNAMIDYFTNKYFNIPYDENGNIANAGKIIPLILDFLMKDEFLFKNPPKSTGREQYSEIYMEKMAKEFHFENYNKEDIITTISEYTVKSISYQYEHFLKNIDLVVVNGGGSHNKYIINRLKQITKLKILTGEEYGINSDAKEAIAFAILGYQTILGKPSNMIKATGAKEMVVLGNITPNPHINNE